MLNEDFEYLIQKFGPPAHPQPLRDAARLKGRLPNALIEFWQQFGLGQWLDGRFQFREPDDLAAILETVLVNDKDFDSDQCSAYGYSAFGIIFVWSSRYNNIYVDMNYGNIRAPYLTNPDARPAQDKLGPDRTIGSNLSGVDQKLYEGADTSGKPLFSRALKKLGRLDNGECYGFVPALRVGGVADLEHLQRVRALEHFSILAGLGPFTLMDYSSGRQKAVRTVGA